MPSRALNWVCRRTRLRRLLLAATAGSVLALGSPPFDLVPALWIGMAGLAWLLSDDPAWPAFAAPARVSLTGAARGLAFGFGANLVALRFIPAVVSRFTPLPWAAGCLGLILLAGFEATRWLLAGVACETLVRARIPRPAAFAAGVYAGTFVPTMLPWTPAGGASPWPAMIQLADTIGERGVAALMALAAGLAAAGARAAIRRESRPHGIRLMAAGLAVIAVQAAAGEVRMREVDGVRPEARARVGLLQPSILATTRWEEDRAPFLLGQLETLTKLAVSRGAELVVWPEAAYPYRLPHGIRNAPDPPRAIVPNGGRTAVLTGLMLTGAPDGAAYNSAIVAYPGGALSESYDKRHLLWFGETVPLADRLPWIRRVFARGLGLAPGESSQLLAAGGIRAAVIICYEDTLPQAGREAMDRAPNLLVNITNDAWFYDSFESELHLRLAALRAVEQRRDLVRAVNRGPTSWIDAAGRLRARASADFPGVLVAEPALIEAPPTIYARFGDAPGAFALLLWGNLAVWRVARRRR